MKSFKEYLRETVVSSAEDSSSDRVGEIAKQFHDEVLSKHSLEVGHPNCALGLHSSYYKYWYENI